MVDKEKQMVNDLIEIFDEEYSRRCLITPQNTAEKMSEKGYRKAEEVAREMCGMLRDDLRGFVDVDYLEKLLKIYEEKYTEGLK